MRVNGLQPMPQRYWLLGVAGAVDFPTGSGLEAWGVDHEATTPAEGTPTDLSRQLRQAPLLSPTATKGRCAKHGGRRNQGSGGIGVIYVPPTEAALEARPCGKSLISNDPSLMTLPMTVTHCLPWLRIAAWSPDKEAPTAIGSVVGDNAPTAARLLLVGLDLAWHSRHRTQASARGPCFSTQDAGTCPSLWNQAAFVSRQNITMVEGYINHG